MFWGKFQLFCFFSLLMGFFKGKINCCEFYKKEGIVMVLQQIKHSDDNNLFASYCELCDGSTFKFVVGKKKLTLNFSL